MCWVVAVVLRIWTVNVSTMATAITDATTTAIRRSVRTPRSRS
jgi:hypothetical protein